MTQREGLQALRQALGGWTQEGLAREMGVRVGTVSRWERESHPLGLRALLRLRKLVEGAKDQRPLAFVEAQMASILEEHEVRIFGVSMRAARKHWVQIAERNWHLTQALKAVEWQEIFPDTLVCPLCDEARTAGHTPDCLIGMALAVPPPTQDSHVVQQSVTTT